MANTQTTVPTFISGQVLTAAQMMNSAATGVPVFANTTTRDAGFGGSGEKVLAEGQLCYLESTNVVQYYDGAAWATLAPAPAVSSGLTLVFKQTLTAATQHNLTNVFSTTYDHYVVKFSSLDCNGGGLNMRYGTSGTPDTGSNYSNNGFYLDVNQINQSGDRFNQSSHSLVGNTSADVGLFLDISSPFLSVKTSYQSMSNALSGSGSITNLRVGILNTATSYTDLVLFSTVNISCTISIYGYAKV